MFSIPGLKVISLTDAAAARIREIMAQTSGEAAPALGLRVGVKKGGCAGMEYTMLKVAEPDAKDERIDAHGVSVFVDPSAVLFLIGTTMDFETTKLRSGFVFRNPNEVSACGCGESVMLKPGELPPVPAA